ncbi:MAG: hypothetical protein ABI668_08175 [Sphingorhabdus sp.]
MTNNDQSSGIRRRSILLAAGATLVLGIVAVLFVLPAETGIDPTGFGKATGLLEIANPEANKLLERGKKRKGVLTSSAKPLAAEPGVGDHWTYDLQPYGEIELKYILDKGAPITFTWSADGSLNYDMHAHPFDGGADLTESYAIAKGDRQSGRYVAAFSGIHGWHWQNRSLQPVRLTVDASGKIAGAKLFNGPTEQDRPLTPAGK